MDGNTHPSLLLRAARGQDSTREVQHTQTPRTCSLASRGTYACAPCETQRGRIKICPPGLAILEVFPLNPRMDAAKRSPALYTLDLGIQGRCHRSKRRSEVESLLNLECSCCRIFSGGALRGWFELLKIGEDLQQGRSLSPGGFTAGCLNHRHVEESTSLAGRTPRANFRSSASTDASGFEDRLADFLPESAPKVLKRARNMYIYIYMCICLYIYI